MRYASYVFIKCLDLSICPWSITMQSLSLLLLYFLGITLDDEDVFLVNINEVIDDEDEATVAKQTKPVTRGKATPAKSPRPGQRARRRRRSQQDSPSGSPAAKRKAGGDASIKEEHGGDDDFADDNMDDDAADDDDGAGCSNWDDEQNMTTGQSEVG